MSFVKLSAGRSGHAPSHDVAAPDTDHVCSGRRSSSRAGGGGAKSPAEAEAGRSSNPSSPRARSSVVSSRPRSSRHFFLTGAGTPTPGGGAANASANAVAAAAVDGAGGGVYSDNSCSVCLDEYEEGDQLLQLTCGHVFHRPCIDHWLKGHCVCPCCR